MTNDGASMTTAGLRRCRWPGCEGRYFPDLDGQMVCLVCGRVRDPIVPLDGSEPKEGNVTAFWNKLDGMAFPPRGSKARP